MPESRSHYSTRTAQAPTWFVIGQLSPSLRRRRGTPNFTLRLSKGIRARLESDAADLGVSAAGYARAILVAHLSFPKPENQGAMHSAMHPRFDRAVKRFLLAYHMSLSVAGLPGKERRNELEGLSWAGLQEASAGAYSLLRKTKPLDVVEIGANYVKRQKKDGVVIEGRLQ